MSSRACSSSGFHLSIHLTAFEAEGLAHLCHLMEWDYLAEHSDTPEHLLEARYALAKLRFALSDAGFSAMTCHYGDTPV